METISTNIVLQATALPIHHPDVLALNNLTNVHSGDIAPRGSSWSSQEVSICPHPSEERPQLTRSIEARHFRRIQQ